MCTSFAVYSKKAVFGMNYDYIPVNNYAVIRKKGSVHSFQLMTEAADRIYPQFIFNSSGFFFNFQSINGSDFRCSKVKTENSIDLFDFCDSIQFASSVQEAVAIMQDHSLSVPLNFKVPILSIQSLLADRSGDTAVFDYDRDKTHITPGKYRPVVMTNFAHCAPPPEKDIQFLELTRYTTADRYIKSHKDFDIDDGLKVLQLTQLNDAPETLVSAVIDVNSSEIYLFLNRNFDRIIKINLKQCTLSGFQGFDADFTIPLTQELTPLEQFL